MTGHLSIAGNVIACDLAGQGPLVVLAHGSGDSRSYRFLAPALAAEGYRVASVGIRGCGDSSLAGTATAAPTSRATSSPSYASSAALP